jgi:hypothetical protein
MFNVRAIAEMRADELEDAIIVRAALSQKNCE